MPEFFLDENIAGKKFSDILRAAGIAFTTSEILNLRGSPDHVWIPNVAASGKIIITGDRRMYYRKVEKAALANSGARVITLAISQRATIEANARNVVNSYTAIARLAERLEPPWLVHLSLPSDADFRRSKAGRLGPNKLTADG